MNLVSKSKNHIYAAVFVHKTHAWKPTRLGYLHMPCGEFLGSVRRRKKHKLYCSGTLLYITQPRSIRTVLSFHSLTHQIFAEHWPCAWPWKRILQKHSPLFQIWQHSGETISFFLMQIIEQRQHSGLMRKFGSWEMVRTAHSAKSRASCKVLPSSLPHLALHRPRKQRREPLLWTQFSPLLVKTEIMGSHCSQLCLERLPSLHFQTHAQASQVSPLDLFPLPARGAQCLTHLSTLRILPWLNVGFSLPVCGCPLPQVKALHHLACLREPTPPAASEGWTPPVPSLSWPQKYNPLHSEEAKRGF